MKTISFKIQLNEELEKVISQDSKICSSMYRFAFCRFQDSKTAGEIYRILSEVFPAVNSHFRNSALRRANGLYTLNGNKKVYFGKFKRFQRKLITKEEYKETRNYGIWSEGEAPAKGNRFF